MTNMPEGSQEIPKDCRTFFATVAKDFPEAPNRFRTGSQQVPTEQKHTHAHCNHISSYGPTQSTALGQKNLAPLADQYSGLPVGKPQG